jgi:hypothetical protein
MFGGQSVYQMGTNCAPLLADLFLYYIHGLIKKNQKKIALSFISTSCYIDDVTSLNNSRVGDFVDLIYPTELEIKDTTHTDRFATYLDLPLEIDRKGKTTAFIKMLREAHIKMFECLIDYNV